MVLPSVKNKQYGKRPGPSAIPPVRCVLGSRSDPAREVHLGIKTGAFYGQEGTAIDALTKLTVSLRVGSRDELMAKELMQDVHARMNKHDDLLVISDGFVSYQTSFPEVFGRDYNVKTKSGRTKTIKRIPHGVAHAVVKKEYNCKRLVGVTTMIAHGTKKCVAKGLKRMGDKKINTSTISG